MDIKYGRGLLVCLIDCVGDNLLWSDYVARQVEEVIG